MPTPWNGSPLSPVARALRWHDLLEGKGAPVQGLRGRDQHARDLEGKEAAVLEVGR